MADEKDGIGQFNEKKFDEITKGLTNIRGLINDTFNPIRLTEYVANLNDQVSNLNRRFLGQTRFVTEQIQDSFAEITLETTRYGIGLEENLKFFAELNSSMLRNTYLTNEQAVNMQLLAKNAGLTTMEVATMVTAFDNLGVGIDGSIERLSFLEKEARSYGLNVGEYMKSISKGIGLLAAFNFKNGIEGFSKMVAKAQALRIDFTKTVNLADTLMDPEKTIELAAGMQMLGGSVGDLADPFRILYLAQNDVAGLQDELLKASQSAVVFNQKTGEFDIPVTEMYRLREMAKLTGKSYQELADEAVKAASRTKKLEMLDLSGIPEEHREMVANLSRIEGGELKINLPGQKESLDATKLTNTELEKLQELDKISKMSDKQIAGEQLSLLGRMATALETPIAAARVLATKTPAISDTLDIGAKFGESITESLIKSLTPEKLNNLGTSITNVIKTSFSNPTTISELKNNLSEFGTTISSNFESLFENILNSLPEEHTYKNVAGGLENITKQLENLGIQLPKTDFSGLNFNIPQISGINNQPPVVHIEQTNPIDTNVKNQIQLSPISPNQSLQIEGEIPVKVDGNISLNLNNLPINNVSQEMMMSLTNNPEFIQKIKDIIKGSNTY
jgi:hypothetical protein